MNTQPDLIFDVCARNHRANPFSTAANSVTAKDRDKARILAFLKPVENATCDETEIALGMGHQTCSARFSELKMSGLIFAACKRQTRTGCMAQAFSVQARSLFQVVNKIMKGEE